MEVGIETGRLQQEECQILGQGINRLSRLPIFINSRPTITVKELLAKCQQLQNEETKSVGLFVVDYVQLMIGKPFECKESRQDKLSRISIGLKSMATNLEAPILLMSQLNRHPEFRRNKSPILSELRETDSLESHTDMVVMSTTNLIRKIKRSLN